MRCDICGQKECCGASLGPELDAMTHERDKLREALEKMLDPRKAGIITYEIGMMQDIARAALREAG